MKSLPKNYDAKAQEKHWQDRWEAQGVYHWEESQPRENTFVIDTPPPTVSGMLHMGHIYSYTQADFIARYQRMSGKTVFYPMGFDDNGLPTERLVEKVKKVRATDMSREDFIQLCEGVAEEARGEFRALFKSIALSVDWRQEYYTISAESRRISQLSFLDLFRKDRAYRKLQPMLWDPVDQTAIAQAEIEDKELPSSMNDILFTVEGSDEKITIATTRPELLAACVSVFYHPDDERYQHLKGKTAITPLFGVKVPLLADENVKIDKGTGLVMCCTFGDETDILWWRTHNLPTRVILNKYGKIDFTVMPAEAGIQLPAEYTEPLKGLKASAAREKSIELLKDAGLLVKQDAIVHAVKCAERSGAPLEILPTPQWFVKILDQKEELKAKAAQCNWNPPYMKIRIDQWIDGLSWDWCISRQRYFGVPFPVWYSKRAGEEGRVLIAEPDQLPINPLVDLPKGYSREEVEPDMDVMDTWATSSVSPQLSAKGITSVMPAQAGIQSENNPFILNAERYSKLFPADLRPQAHEIIRTWAFYTIVKAHLHEDTIPWHNLMISGWCLAADKTKMSKSKGNVVTPIALIEEKGADAVRYWASTSRLGADTAFSEDVLKIGKKLTTKLWNATQFAALHVSKLEGAPNISEVTNTLDRWIISRLHKTVDRATQEFERFEYCNARIAVEEFFWNDFCDNYLELVKSRAYNEAGNDDAGQRSALVTLYYCLDALLRLFAPIVPHVTEELYSYLFSNGESVHARGSWPKASAYPKDDAAEANGIACVSVLNAIRKAKSEAAVSIKYPVEHLALSGQWSLIAPILEDLKAAGNVVEIAPQETAASNAVPTEDGQFTLAIRFAEKTEASASA